MIPQEESIPPWNSFLTGIDSSCMKKREERGHTHVVFDKSISPSKIKISWAMSDSIPYSVPTRFLALIGASKIAYGFNTASD